MTELASYFNKSLQKNLYCRLILNKFLLFALSRSSLSSRRPKIMKLHYIVRLSTGIRKWCACCWNIPVIPLLEILSMKQHLISQLSTAGRYLHESDDNSRLRGHIDGNFSPSD